MLKSQRKNGLKVLSAVLLILGVLLLLYSVRPSAAEEAMYIGGNRCKGCHKKQHEAWMGEKHSKAFQSLKDNEKQDPNCLGCHTTGYGKPSKGKGEKKVDLNNVQCEACHGPGSLYKSVKIMSRKRYKEDPEGSRKKAIAAGLIIKPDEKLCSSCHNEKSPTFKGFDYPTDIEKVNHLQ